ncbi:PAAR domain-containing protein [Paraburkholderia sp. FT54]|uniref:PAAR domain-containing protein n=1 Tax=Paraburkholderia sp. FT54 TaxID=3074437 RepID=UPI00287768C4|nr:PAAR domain-containing protein [Paraburkholderia sp. FT54]WNC92484.1 PAAR domain-containing protein [Paraburkholderia sp. FT54]
MRIPIVRHGDETTTRGKVLAFTATIHDDGRKIALHGDQATCGNCKGLWKIIGTGEGAGENGRAAVINGDHVLCPCGKNRVFAGADAGMFLHIDTGTASAAPHKAAPVEQYDEQFTLLDDARRPLAHVRYRIVVDGKRMITGTTSANGQTERVATHGASSLQLQLEN